MSDQIKIIDDYLQRLWNQKDLSIIDQYVSERVQIKSALGQTFGISGMKQVVMKWLEAFPDLQCDFFQYKEELDTVVSYWRATATHLGTFLNIPATGKKMNCEGIAGYKLKNGKIIDYSVVVDMQHIIGCLHCE